MFSCMHEKCREQFLCLDHLPPPIILENYNHLQFPDDSEDDRSGQEMVKENDTCSTIRRSFCPFQYNVTCDIVLASRESG